MALRRPTPKNLTAEDFNEIVAASAQQTGKATRLRSYDPNFPLFETPMNKKLLVYVPNHTIMNPDGTLDIRKDKFAAHATKKGREFNTIRCTSGVVSSALHLDGTCPFCEAEAEIWDLYNREYEEIAKSKGIDPASPEAKDSLKQQRIELLNNQAVKRAEVFYTFPIVVIDCEENNGVLTTTPKKDEEGKISGKTFWYTVKEKTYVEKWKKGLETVSTEDDTVPTSPAGLWAVLDFTYESKDGKHDKMGSGRALAVGYKTMSKNYNAWANYFDELTEEWTPAKAMETLVDNAIRDMDEQREAADDILKPVRDRMAMFTLGSIQSVAPQVAGTADADAALAQFGGTVVSTESSPMSEVPQVGVTQ